VTTPCVDRVIVGITGSLSNLAALHVAVAQCRRSGAALVAVRAWLPAGGEIAYRRGPCPPLLQAGREQAGAVLRGAFTDAFGGLPSDVPVECAVLRGETAPSLVALADRPTDLLVVGSGRRGFWAGLRLRSVSRYCFSHAHCPVLAVPPPVMLRELRAHRVSASADAEFAVRDSA
jgi:nucleotide-binding universal stress UspA family protein